MANVIEIIGKAEGQGFDELTAKMQAISSETKATSQDLIDLQREMQAALAKAKNADESAAVMQKYGAMIQGAENRMKGLKTEQDNTKKSIEALSDAQKKMPGEIVAQNSAKAFRTLYMETMNNIKAMEMNGQTGTDAYNKLIAKAAEMSQIQRRVNEDIKNMGSETAGIDAVVSSVGFVTGGFTALTGAMTLFAGENEFAQEAMKKLQSVMAISMGISQASNALLKQSAMMQGIATIQTKAATVAENLKTTATGKSVIATTAATIAQKLFNAVAKANPYVLLAMALITVVGALAAFAVGTGKSKAEQEKLNKETENYKDYAKDASSAAATQITKYKKLQDQWNALGDDINKKNKFVKDNQKAFDDLGVSVKNVKEAENLFVGNTEAFVAATIIKAKALAAQNLAAKSYEEAIKQQLEAEKLQKQIDNIKPTVNFGNRVAGALSVSLTAEDFAKADMPDEIKKLNEQKQKAINLSTEAMTAGNDAINATVELTKEQQEILKKANIQNAKSTGGSKNEQNQRNAQILKAQQELAAAKAAAIADGEAKELAQLQASTDKKIEEIKKTFKNQEDFQKNASKAEKDLVIFYTEQAQTEKTKIIEKYANQRAQQTLDTEKSNISAQLALVRKGSEEEASLKIQLIENQAETDRQNVLHNTSMTEEQKAAKIKEINSKSLADISQINDDWYESERTKTITNAEKTAKETASAQELILKEQYSKGLISKYDYEQGMRDISINSLQEEIDARRNAGESTVELEKEMADKRIEIAEQEKEARKQIFQELFNLLGDIGNAFFDAQKQNLDQQAADLDHYYTTDAEAAKKNKNLKLISEEEMSRRQLEIKRKQAQAEKDQALFNAFINMASGIVTALGSAPPPYNIILAAITGAAAMIQIAAIQSRPLPKYAKGRKGGKGEFGIVGEKGAEMMWIPDGASIMPNADVYAALRGDKSKFVKWDMPAIDSVWQKNLPELNQKLIAKVSAEKSERIDYERLGRVVAKNVIFPKIPKSKSVTVNVDRNGISILEGNTETKVGNYKFGGTY